MVGADGDNSAGINAGAVYILYLKQREDEIVKKAVRISEEDGGFDASLSAYGRFGTSVAEVGSDLDGNGVDDLVVGASDYEISTGYDGHRKNIFRVTFLRAIYILYMKEDKTAPVLHAQTITGLNPIFEDSFSDGDQFGCALTAMNLDLDGNGVNELVVGVPGDGEKGKNSGKRLLIYDDKIRSV